MTAPQFPAGWAPPAPAQQAPPVQQYQQAPPAYAPAPPAPQQYQQAPVQQYAPAPQQYQQAPPAYAPQQYAPPPVQYGPPPQQAPQLARPESLDDYLNQPASGIGWWQFKQEGQSHLGMVTRALSANDVIQKTFQGQPQTRRDGSPEWNIVIPLVGPDGVDAQWEVSGKAKTELKNKVIAAGGPESGVPEAGSFIRATFTHRQQNNNGSASKIIAVEYTRPQAAGAPAPAPAPVAAPVQEQAPPMAAAFQQSAPQQYAAAQAPIPQQFQQATPPQQFQQAPAAQPAPAPQAVQLDPAAQAQYNALLGGAPQ